MALTVLSGEALWAKVFTPDTKFDANGIYSVDVLIDESEAAALIEKIEAVRDAYMAEEVKRKPAKAKTHSVRPVCEPHFDQDGNDTGMVKFKTKIKAQGQRKDGSTYTQKVAVVDAKRKPIVEEMEIGNGSEIKVAVELRPYEMSSTKQFGVSLRLKAVQVVKLVEYGGGGIDVFAEVEGGFEASDATPAVATDSPFVEDDDDGDQGDF